VLKCRCSSIELLLRRYQEEFLLKLADSERQNFGFPRFDSVLVTVMLVVLDFLLLDSDVTGSNRGIWLLQNLQCKFNF
jgi:hypothetical protein